MLLSLSLKIQMTNKSKKIWMDISYKSEATLLFLAEIFLSSLLIFYKELFLNVKN